MNCHPYFATSRLRALNYLQKIARIERVISRVKNKNSSVMKRERERREKACRRTDEIFLVPFELYLVADSPHFRSCKIYKSPPLWGARPKQVLLH